MRYNLLHRFPIVAYEHLGMTFLSSAVKPVVPQAIVQAVLCCRLCPLQAPADGVVCITKEVPSTALFRSLSEARF